MKTNYPNKMQTAEPKAVCPICKGAGKVKSADGATTVCCQACRGTGQSGGYCTK